MAIKGSWKIVHNVECYSSICPTFKKTCFFIRQFLSHTFDRGLIDTNSQSVYELLGSNVQHLITLVYQFS